MKLSKNMYRLFLIFCLVLVGIVMYLSLFHNLSITYVFICYLVIYLIIRFVSRGGIK